LRKEAIDKRIKVFTVGFGVLLAIITWRLFYIQIIQHRQLSQRALRQQERTIKIQPQRGKIFDRRGRPLALNRQAASFYAVPSEIKNPSQAARRLYQATGVSAVRLQERFKSRRAFVWIKRKVSDAGAKKIRAMKLTGVHELFEPTRVYPEGRLACHVLGFVGLDNQGLSGVELQFDRAICGQSGLLRIARDAKGQRLPASTRVFKRPEPGQDIYLTIDKVVQHIAERELARGMKKSRALAGSIVVMNPNTGEILALANLPDFDPNHYNRFPVANQRNRVINDIYEPGSTFKLITAAAALEEGVFREEDIIHCENGRGVFDGRVVRDHEPKGRLSFRDVIILSSNVGAVKIGIRLGAEKLTRYARDFGFGRPTGIELPGERVGMLKPHTQWKNCTMTSVPFGQGVAVTTLQIAAAYAAVANQGRLLRPYIVREQKRPDGVIVRATQPEIRRQVISARTAEQMRSILKDVVEKGTGTWAQVANYTVAGKTGTAQKIRPRGGYDAFRHVASFVGFFPADKPKLLIAVMIDEPRGLQWGGLVAGPVFKEISRHLVAYLGIPPGPQKVYAFAKAGAGEGFDLKSHMHQVPGLKGLSIDESRRRLKQLGLQAACLGKGKIVLEQRPAEGRLINAASRVVLYLGDTAADKITLPKQEQILVPNVAGQTLRNALQILGDYGLQARISGSGVVNRQKPGPNTLAKVGQTCMINCVDPENQP